MASTDTSFSVAGVAADVQTIGQARAVLGVVAGIVQDAYAELDASEVGRDLKSSLHNLLDVVNADAQRLYAIYAGATPDLFDQEISISNAAQIGVNLEYARSALAQVEAAVGIPWDFTGQLKTALAGAGAIAQTGASGIARAAAAAGAGLAAAFWPYLLVLAVGVFVYFRFVRRLVRAGGGS